MSKGSAKSFASAVTAWVKQTEADSMEVLKDSVRAVAAEARAAVPRDTGNLARSIVLSQTIPQIGGNDEVYPDPTANDEAVLANVQIGAPIYLGARASYSARREYGYVSRSSAGLKNVPGTFAVTQAMNKWKGLVKRVAMTRGRRAK